MPAAALVVLGLVAVLIGAAAPALLTASGAEGAPGADPGADPGQDAQTEPIAGLEADPGAQLLPDPGAGAGLLEQFGAQLRRLWNPPAAAAPYLEAIAAAERERGLPEGVLARLIYEESRYRPDIIDGSTRSAAGAVGIAQFMPATAQQRGVDPLDPFASIRGSADYLRSLFDKFGSWSGAVAAYNWGPGNWAAFLRTGAGVKGQPRPQENIAYVDNITRDAGLL